MVNRRGLGKGQGKGYKNIIGKDPAVHSQSAKGIKQPQKLKVTMSRPMKKKGNNPNLPDEVFNKILQEKEMKLLKRRLNDNKITPDEIFDRQEYFQLSTDFQEKGKDWLMNLWQTPKGKEREHNPFNAREEYVLENFDRIELVDFQNTAQPMAISMGLNNYQPVYRVYAKDGTNFSYYVGFMSRNQKVPINLL